MESTVGSSSMRSGASSMMGSSTRSGFSQASSATGSSSRSFRTQGTAATTRTREQALQVTNPTDGPSEGALRPEEIDYDRREIRRKLREKLEIRGDPVYDVVGGGDGENGDDDYLYEDDDAEFFPWKRREAAVAAAVAGGRTEGRIEGFDSMERAMQAHKHKLHYGRGRGFGWSQQKTTRNMDTSSRRQLLTDWESFRQLNKGQDPNNPQGAANASSSPEMLDFQRERKLARQRYWLNTAMVMVSVTLVIGFVFLLENLKLSGYQEYLPKGYVAPDELDINQGGAKNNGLNRPVGLERPGSIEDAEMGPLTSFTRPTIGGDGSRRMVGKEQQTQTTTAEAREPLSLSSRQDAIQSPPVTRLVRQQQQKQQQRPHGRLLDHSEMQPHRRTEVEEQNSMMNRNPFDMMEHMFAGDNVMMKLPSVANQEHRRRRLGES